MYKYFIFIFLLVLTACGKNDVVSITKNGKQGEGVCIYALDYHRLSLDYHIDVSKISLPDKPLISYNDIEKYDTARHVLQVKKSVLDSLDFPRAWVVTVDHKPVYGGWTFYNYMSSICSWVCVVPDDTTDNLSPGEIKIDLGYPARKFFDGSDPRNNSLIINRLAEDNKIK